MTHSDLQISSPTSWRDRWLGWRNRLLANPRFQRWAASFPLTKPVAEARARDLFDICAGFVYAQVLSACVRVRLFPLLEGGPMALDTIAARIGLPPDGARCMLDAAATLELVSKLPNGRYGLGALGAAFLGNPGLAEMVAHHDLFYQDMADPLALLRPDRPPGRLQAFWAYARDAAPKTLKTDAVGDYTSLMASSQGFVATDILDAFPLDRARCLMDLGGGDGSFLISAAARAPQLRLILFDLPAVAAQAEARFTAAGLGQRARAVGGDFRRDTLPAGADVISLVRVVHDHDDFAARAILHAARAALAPGGTLIIAEPMADAPGAERVGAAYFNFYLRAMGSGRARSAGELQDFLKQAGFASVRPIPTRRPLLTGLIAAS